MHAMSDSFDLQTVLGASGATRSALVAELGARVRDVSRDPRLAPRRRAPRRGDLNRVNSASRGLGQTAAYSGARRVVDMDSERVYA